MKLEKIIQQTNIKNQIQTLPFLKFIADKKKLPRQINELFPYFLTEMVFKISWQSLLDYILLNSNCSLLLNNTLSDSCLQNLWGTK